MNDEIIKILNLQNLVRQNPSLFQMVDRLNVKLDGILENTIIIVDSWEYVMKPAQEKIEKIDQRLRIQPLRGGNLLYITQMNNSWMIQMKRPPFYI